MPDRPAYDPIALLRALEERRVNYVLVGTLAAVLRGAPETTHLVEICPSLREENLLRLDRALNQLGAKSADGGQVGVVGIAAGEARRFETPYGELVIEPRPDGTRGFDDLRRQATRELLDDHGLRSTLASLADLLRTIRARGLSEDGARIQVYRRLDELTHELERSSGIEI